MRSYFVALQSLWMNKRPDSAAGAQDEGTKDHKHGSDVGPFHCRVFLQSPEHLLHLGPIGLECPGWIFQIRLDFVSPSRC